MATPTHISVYQTVNNPPQGWTDQKLFEYRTLVYQQMESLDQNSEEWSEYSGDVALVNAELVRRGLGDGTVLSQPRAISDEQIGADPWTDQFAPGYKTYTGDSSSADRNTSFSGCDITPVLFAKGKLFTLGNIQTLTYSVHREKGQVRTLGRIYNKGVTRGQVTIAGSLIFTVFDRSSLYEIIDLYNYEKTTDYNPDSDTASMRSPLTHQVPPFDITVTFMNEYGNMSYMRLYGVEIMDEGQTMSVDDMMTENIMQYIARDIDLMVPHGMKTGRKIAFDSAIFNTGRYELIGAGNLARDIQRYRNAITFLENLEQTLQDAEGITDTTLLSHIPVSKQVLLKGGEMIYQDVKDQLISKGLWSELKGDTEKQEQIYKNTGRFGEYLVGLEQLESKLETYQGSQIQDISQRSRDIAVTDIGVAKRL